jgi:hypothetical protein
MTEHDPINNGPQLPMEELRQLARSGVLCSTCGGTHTSTADVAILASAAGLPFCECPECELCRPIREAIERLIATSGFEPGDHSDDRSHPQ